MRAPALLAAALLLTFSAAACVGVTAREARENPDAVQGDQRAVLRGTAMSERSSMGADLLETLRAANENPRAAPREPGAPAPSRFNTFVAALETAGLTETLQSEGPYTLFAPTDDAFRQFSTARLETLLQPANRGKLRRLLRYHLVEGNLVADELAQRSPVSTVQGRRLTIKGEDADITVDGARVLQADVGTANGTIHVIDRVLIPPSLR